MMNSPPYVTRNNLSEPLREKMIQLLNQHLADIIDLQLQAKQAHWNVKGPNFIGLHELFDRVAGEIEDFADSMAERAVELGGVAKGTLQIVVKVSRLSVYRVDLETANEHVDALSGALAAFGASARAAVDTAAQEGDANSADLFTEVSRGIDKLTWLVEAHGQGATT